MHKVPWTVFNDQNFRGTFPHPVTNGPPPMAKSPVLGTAIKQAFKDTKSCPPATQDIHINLANRNHAIKEYGYGPLNPNEANEKFWNRLAKLWGISVTEAKTARCGNCSAFVQTKNMLACIANGMQDEDEPAPVKKAEGIAAQAVTASANLGYCQLFHFKCAGDRTCDAWLVGGPLT